MKNHRLAKALDHIEGAINRLDEAMNAERDLVLRREIEIHLDVLTLIRRRLIERERRAGQ